MRTKGSKNKTKQERQWDRIERIVERIEKIQLKHDKELKRRIIW